MQTIYTGAKYLALNYLPGSVLAYVKKVHYARKLRNFPLEKEPDMEVVRHLVEPGDYAVDIGANVGLYTLVLSGLVGVGGRVYSIEPVPETFGILCSNIGKLRLGNVVPVNRAVSDSPSMLTMSIPRHLNHAGNFYRAHVSEQGSDDEMRVLVQAQTMDSLFQNNLDRFSFVKCDVEGHELRCIRGARKFLQDSDASWLIEVSDDPDDSMSNSHALFNELFLRGYRPWWFDGAFLREREKGDRCMNCFFLREHHLNSVRRRAPHMFS